MEVFILFVQSEDMTEVFYSKKDAMKYAREVINNEEVYETFLKDGIGESFKYGKVELIERTVKLFVNVIKRVQFAPFFLKMSVIPQIDKSVLTSINHSRYLVLYRLKVLIDSVLVFYPYNFYRQNIYQYIVFHPFLIE